MVATDVQEVLEKGIFYDRRVVTYKWLTWKLNLHPNAAKQCLQKFVSEQESENANITGQSVVTGATDKVLRVVLTARSSVVEAKKRMASVSGVHLYSACPANLEALEERLAEAATASNRLDFDPRCFPIECEAATRSVSRRKREPAEVKRCDDKVQAPVQPVAPAKEEPETNGTSKARHPTKKADAKATKSGKTKGKQANVASMFTAKAADSAAKTTPKQSPPPARKSIKREKTPERVAEQKPPPPASPESPVHKRKRTKKRKALSDSEPSDDESVLTPASSLTTPSTTGKKSGTDGVDGSSSKDDVEKGKKRRKVLKPVRETYKDDDGFLVTRTVKQLVSESDDDEEPIPKVAKEQQQQQKGNNEGKKNVRAEMKQQTLFSFLRKK